jgi:rubredoxin
MEKLNTEWVKNGIIKKGGHVEDTFEYLGCFNKFKIICIQGHSFETTWNRIKGGSWCPYCSGKKVNEKKAREFIKNKGGELNKNWKYKGIYVKFLISCEKGHKWKTNWHRIQQNQWCPICSGHKKDKKDIRKFIENKKGKILRIKKYINNLTKILILCENGHEFETCWLQLQQKQWCPKCASIRSAKKRTKNENYIRKFIEEKSGILNDNWVYSGCYIKFPIICENGHRFETHWNRLWQKHWCPYCKNKSQQKFRETIEKYFNASFPSKNPKWLYYPETGRLLQLDGYNNSLKIAFEFQGQQHYKEVSFFHNCGERFESLKKRDLFKKEKCKEKGILLICVPYWLSEMKWKNLIKRKISADRENP